MRSMNSGDGPRRSVETSAEREALAILAAHVRAAGAKGSRSRVLVERSTRSSTAARLVSLATGDEGSLGLRAERWDIRERRARSIVAKLGATRVLTQARRR